MRINKKLSRQDFLKTSALAVTAVATPILTASAQNTASGAKPEATKAVYEWRTYETRFGAPQAPLEDYLKMALIPALNRLGVKNVGVFKEVGKSDPAKLHLLISYPSWNDYMTAAGKLTGDQAYTQASQAYAAITPDKSPFTRYTTSLMSAFDGLPQLAVPTKEARIFELRTYEGYSEDAVRRKVKMFNVDEIPIFYHTKLNPVFFGEVVAGEHMPCLTYMLTFKNMEERDANWKMFVADADWKRISALPEYANTVSNIIRIFLEPTAYSQV